VSIYGFDDPIPRIASVDTTVGEHFFERDASVTEAIRNFDDVRTKAHDPLTSVDIMEELAGGK
jgi:hypothetical protein